MEISENTEIKILCVHSLRIKHKVIIDVVNLSSAYRVKGVHVESGC